jgi:hypothetical protein
MSSIMPIHEAGRAPPVAGLAVATVRANTSTVF